MFKLLRSHLEHSKQASRTEISEFLSPDLTLNKRLTILRRLIQPPDNFPNTDWSRIFALISWRNDIMHGEGSKLQRISEADFDSTFHEAHALAIKLVNRNLEWKAWVEFRPIVVAIRERFGFVANITQYRHHRVKVEIGFFDLMLKTRPSADALESKVLALISLVQPMLQSRDRYFTAEKHLWIEFAITGLTKQVITQYREGNLDRQARSD